MIDTAKIIVEAGKGGDGAVSFRREKYVPKGGPDGGDGGRGGNVICQTTREINTLADFHRVTKYRAQDGEPGGKQKRHGSNADSLTIRVPIGTIIKDDKDNIVADLVKDNQLTILARGGKGGRGNWHFATATHQTPREFEPGQAGENNDFLLELKLLADVGLIGLPNSGKSTLLASLTKAKPKIADYPFTTLDPNLGVASYKKNTYVIADVPGLIEGAAHGKGLGDQFLKHLERTLVLVHLVKADVKDPIKAYKLIRQELGESKNILTKKPEIIALSQIDRIDSSTVKKILDQLKEINPDSVAISAQTKDNLDALQNKIIKALKYEREIL